MALDSYPDLGYVQTMLKNTHCPRCESNDTQAARMVIASGTSDWQGAALSQQLGPDGGFGYTAMGGTSQSRLAAMLDPGPAPSYVYPFLATALFATVVYGYLFFKDVPPHFVGTPIDAWLKYWAVHPLAPVLPTFLVALLGVVFFLRCRHRRVGWCDRLARLDHTWLCRKCGCAFEA